MLTHLKLENFKIWRSTGPLRLAPLTMLLGTNSSGKSSLIQSLLLIRQTVKSDDPNLDLNLGIPDSDIINRDSVTLGQFQDVLCRSGSATSTLPANQFAIEFRWSKTSDETNSSVFSAHYRKGPGGSAELNYLHLGKSEEGFTVKRKKPGIYQLNLANQRRPLGQSASYRPERSFAFSAAALAKLGEHADSIRNIGPALLDELSRIIYLGPVRRLARRDYTWNGRMPAHIGDDGARAIDALIASGIECQALQKKKAELTDEAKLFTQTEYWLKQMQLAEGLAVKQLGRSSRYELHIINHGEASNIKDVGVGVSQVLPVIVAALFAKPGHIVIIEEPETHLHPLAQGKLAELLATLSHNRQFIIETHSEHLFRRIQTLIAREELKKNATAMYFVEREDKVASARTLEIDDYGRVTNWPKGFFGDALGETQEQARLMFERQSE